MKAVLRNYRQSPRKVRLVADFIRGKKVDRALQDLSFLSKRAAEPVLKLLKSASANAKENGSLTEAEQNDLYVKEIRVDEGATLKRFRARARGRASSIHKRSSHIAITLGTKSSPVEAHQKASSKKEEKKETK